jgi:hypothetical protein
MRRRNRVLIDRGCAQDALEVFGPFKSMYLILVPLICSS